MRYRHPILGCAFLSGIIAAVSPLFAGRSDLPSQMAENLAASQRMADLSAQMNNQMQSRMRVLLAQGLTRGDSPIDLTGGPGGAIVVRSFARMEKGAFLGISGSPVSPVLREQLKLPRGACLVVDYVAKDSPAEVAGVKVHDILEKLDDQLIVNAPQFLVLVRNKKAGDDVALTILHEGQSTVVTAKLIEKDLPALEDEESAMLMTGPGMEMNPIPLGGEIEPSTGMRKSFRAEADGSTVRTMWDGKYHMTLETDKDGNGLLTVQDRDGKELFKGAYTTEDDKQKVEAAYGKSVRGWADAKGPELGKVLTGGPDTHSMSLSRTDGEHEIHITIDDKGKRCVVKDVKTGGVIFDGMVNDPDTDMKDVDPAVVAKVKALLAKAAGK